MRLARMRSRLLELPRHVARGRALCTQALETQDRERARSYKVVEWSLKTIAMGWFVTKSWEYCSTLDTLLANSSVALVGSRDPGFQSSGVWRIDRFHTSEAGMAEVIKSNGIAQLMKTLDHPEPATRLLSLKLLVSMAPIGSARSELVAGDALTAAERSCTGMSHAPDTARCQELTAARPVERAESGVLAAPQLGHPAYSAPTHEASSCGAAWLLRALGRAPTPHSSSRISAGAARTHARGCSPRTPRQRCARRSARPASGAGARRPTHSWWPRRRRGRLRSGGATTMGSSWRGTSATCCARSWPSGRPNLNSAEVPCLHPLFVYSKWTRRSTAGAPARGHAASCS